MDATPKELRDTDLGDAFRGYNRDQVDELLDRAAATIERLQESSRQLTERVAAAETDAGRGRETEDMLHRTLLLAQRTADEAVAEARARATQITEEAEARSRALLSEAETSARRVADAEQKRLSTEVADLTTRRDTLHRDVDALEQYAAEYRARLRGMIEADLDALNSDSTPPLPPRPTLRSGEPMSAGAPAPPPPPDAWTPPPPAPTYTPPPAPDATAEPEPAPAPEPAPEGEATMSYAALSEPRPDEPRGGGDASGGVGLFHAENAAPLDDDAFFASLRDAVRDERPLGSDERSDAEGEGLYDQDTPRDDLGYGGAPASGDAAGYGLFRRRR